MISKEIPDYDMYDEKKFYTDIRKRVEEIKSRGNEPLLPVGNPFVDNGILAISIIRDIDDITSLTIEDALMAFLEIGGENSWGKEFCERTYIAKALFMVLMNNPIMQTSYASKKENAHPAQKQDHKNKPSPLQIRAYTAYLVEFLAHYLLDLDILSTKNCLVCGFPTNFNINQLDAKLTYLINEKKITFGSGATRIWFPLLGSKSSSQNFPAYSEGGLVCGKCLFTVQFLPQVSNLYNGRLVAYQTTEYRFSRLMINANFEVFSESYLMDPFNKIETPGKKNSKIYLFNNLLTNISVYEREYGNLTITLWLYTNSGTEPDCEKIIFPDKKIKFLQQLIAHLDVKDTILHLLKIEDKALKKVRERFLMNRMLSSRDYELFYQKIKVKGKLKIPQRLYNFYQHAILNWSREAIEYVFMASKKITQKMDEKTLSNLLIRDDYELISVIRRQVLNDVSEGNLSDAVFMELFGNNFKEIPRRSPYSLFRFHLHPENDDEEFEFFEFELGNYKNTFSEFDLELIGEFANETLKQMRKRARFDENRYLDRLHSLKRHDITLMFISLSRIIPGYTWEIFEKLVNRFNRFTKFKFFLEYFMRKKEEHKPSHRSIDLEKESKLHPRLINALENYIQVRSDEVGYARLMNELPNDLRRGNYSADGLLILLNKKLKIMEKEPLDSYFFYYNASQFDNQNKGAEPSWFYLRNKIAVYLYQKQLLRKEEPTLLEQIKEENI